MDDGDEFKIHSHPRTYHYLKLKGPEEAVLGFFEGPPPQIGDAVEFVCTERSPGEMTLQLRVKKD